MRERWAHPGPGHPRAHTARVNLAEELRVEATHLAEATSATDPRDVLRMIDAFPHPIGEGPYRIKGNAYRGKLEYFEGHEISHEALMTALDRPAIARFLEQTFFPSVWYDVLPMVASTAALAIVHDESFEARVAARARHQVHRDMKGVYRMIMRWAPARILAQRVPVVVAQHFDFVRVDATARGDTNVDVQLSTIPRPIDMWIEVVIRTYMEELVRASATRDVEVESYRISAEGATSIPATNVLFSVRWR